MTEVILNQEQEQTHILDNAITLCKICKKIVPKTNLCINCGAPILFKNVKNVKKLGFS